MALKGNLKDFSTTQLLNLVNLARKTGTLIIDGGNSDRANVAFKEGKLIYAALGEQDGELAMVLARSGKLTRDQARQISDRARKTSDKQLGLMLINAGYVTQADIIQSIKGHLRNIILKLFNWTEGVFQFESDTMPSSDRITVSVELENLIMEGTRRLKELDLLTEEVPNLDMALKFPSQPRTKLDKVSLSVDEWKVISFVKPENSIRMIAKAHNMGDQQVRRIVYSLLQAGLVELTRPASADAAINAMRRARQRTQESEVKATVVYKLIERIRSL